MYLSPPTGAQGNTFTKSAPACQASTLRLASRHRAESRFFLLRRILDRGLMAGGSQKTRAGINTVAGGFCVEHCAGADEDLLLV